MEHAKTVLWTIVLGVIFGYGGLARGQSQIVYAPNGPSDVADTYIFADGNYNGATGAWVGYNTTDEDHGALPEMKSATAETAGSLAKLSNFLVKFNTLPDVDAADVTKVELGLYRTDTKDLSELNPLQIVPAAAFVESETWATADAANKTYWSSTGYTGMSTMDVHTGTGEYKYADVTDMVKSWLSGASVNNGFLIMCPYAASGSVSAWKALYMASSDNTNVNIRPVLKFSLATKAPVFDPAGPEIDEPTLVTISSATTGATIYYTTDGSEPTSSGTAYSNPTTVTVGNGTILRAIAVGAGDEVSSETSQTYTIGLSFAPNGPDDVDDTYIFANGNYSGATGAWVPYNTTDEDHGALPEMKSATAESEGSLQYLSNFLVKFNTLPDIDPVQITKVELGLYRTDTKDLSELNPLQIIPAAPFVESEIWATADAVNKSYWNSAGYAGMSTMDVHTGTGEYKYADVTDMVKSWLSGSSVNNGFLIMCPYAQSGSASAWKALYMASSDHADENLRPLLKVEYIVTKVPVFDPAGPGINGPTQVTISSATAGATIYYTTNGTTPTTSGTAYTNPTTVTVSDGMTLRAIAVDYDTSPETSQTYTVGVAAAPNGADDVVDTYIFEIGNYSGVTGGWVPYETSGESHGSLTEMKSSTGETAGSVAYLSNFLIKFNNLPAVDPSQVTSVELGLYRTDSYDLSGLVGPLHIVSAASFGEDEIWSTADGDNKRHWRSNGYENMSTMPVGSGYQYADVTDTVKGWLSGSSVNNGFMIMCPYASSGSASAWKPLAVASSDNATESMRPTLKIYFAATMRPVFDPAGPDISGDTLVTISSATTGATIYYTTDGSEPTTGGTAHTNPTTVTVGNGTILRAIAVGTDTSPEQSQTYLIPAPVFSPDDIYISGSTPITITSTLPGAAIYYTTDGSTPSDSNGMLYSSAVTISSDTTLKAVAISSGYSSNVTTQTFRVPTLPILAWGGVQPSFATPGSFEALKAAGFTHQLYYYYFNDVQTVLDLGKEVGIKTFIVAPSTASEIAEVQDHVALGGYFVADEPYPDNYASVAAEVQTIQALDPDHLCYINLFATYVDVGMTYENYVDSFLNTVPVEMLSFDHYPVKTSGIRSDFYENLEIISAAAEAEGIPFWAFVCSIAMDSGNYPIPTLTDMRFQVYSNLAYGAQAIQYFTYANPTSLYPDYHDSPVDINGNPTATYYVVQDMNEEIKGLSPVFFGAEVVSVGHTGSLPSGTTAYAASAPITSLTATGSDGAIVSELINGDDEYLVVVNRDIDSTMSLSIATDTSKTIYRVFKDGSKTVLTGGTLSCTVDPADIVVLQLSTAQIPGDANGDGAVDVGDLGILAANYGTTSGATWAMGDFTGDGAVDVGDLGVLAANYGTGSSGSCDFEVDYAKVFGTSAEAGEEETTSTLCSTLGLPLIAGLALMGLMLIKLDE